jgi:hypothetical protein
MNSQLSVLTLARIFLAMTITTIAASASAAGAVTPTQFGTATNFPARSNPGAWLPPPNNRIPSGSVHRAPSNSGNVTNIINAPIGPYSTDLGDLTGKDPNGVWSLFIYDDKQGGLGQLQGSWQINFFFQ